MMRATVLLCFCSALLQPIMVHGSLIQMLGLRAPCQDSACKNHDSLPGEELDEVLLAEATESSEEGATIPSTQASPQPRRHPSSLTHLRSQRRQKPSGWFSSFDDAESTYTTDAVGTAKDDPEMRANFKPDASDHNLEKVDTLDPEWFDESPSNGAKAQWQTHYPDLTSAGKGSSMPWRKQVNGRWQQVYEPPAVQKSMKKGAQWFDTSAEEYDAFGRKHEPLKRDDPYSDWTLKSFTTTLKCSTPGCDANTSLKIYEPDGEAVSRPVCALTFQVHATDFDDEHSKENVEWIKVNNQTIVTHCDPMERGCQGGDVNNTKALFPCIRKMDVNNILSAGNGTLNFAAKITKMVDECPFEGNLLSAAITVDCKLPRDYGTTTTTTYAAKGKPTSFTDRKPLQCTEPGCVATSILSFDKSKIVNHTCKLAVKVNVTDFDQNMGTDEKIVWIKADDVKVKADCTPGKNPCIAENTTTPKNREVATCVTDHDVGSLIVDGSLIVHAKLSDDVDECASQGFLLDGIAEVVCMPKAK